MSPREIDAARGRIVVERRLGAARCGTVSGYKAHLRLGEVTCEACRAANNEFARERRQATA
jgi:hypothetical protein